jgi:predicted dehydrogenase
VPNEHSYKDYRALLLRERPDFVVIATPHISHATIAIDCLRAGVPVLVEKPMAATLSAAERMVETSEKEKVPLAVIHNYAARAQAELARRLLGEGAIGRPFLFRAEVLGVGWSPGAETFDVDWRAKSSVAGGGCFLDNGYHFIYLAQNYLGPVASVCAHVATYSQPIDVDDTALVLLSHTDGSTTSVQAARSMAGDSQPVNEVYGTGGTMRIEPGGTVAISRAGRDWERHHAPADPGFATVFRNFLETVHGHGVPFSAGRDGLETLRFVRAAYASATANTAVDVASYTE